MTTISAGPPQQRNLAQDHADNLRTEYTALSSYFNTVISFRFTTIGLYLAAVGFIVSGSISTEKAFLLLGLSFILWLMDLRNRTLFYNLAERGMQIEWEYWRYRGLEAYNPFYRHMMKERPPIAKDPNAPDRPPPDFTKILFWKIAVGHSLSINLLFSFIILFALYIIVSCNIRYL